MIHSISESFMALIVIYLFEAINMMGCDDNEAILTYKYAPVQKSGVL